MTSTFFQISNPMRPKVQRCVLCEEPMPTSEYLNCDDCRADPPWERLHHAKQVEHLLRLERELCRTWDTHARAAKRPARRLASWWR